MWKGKKGSELILQCQSVSDNRWYYRSPIDRVVTRSNVLRINPVEFYHNGDYYCYGSYIDSSSHFLAKATVKVYGKLVIVIEIVFISMLKYLH